MTDKIDSDKVLAERVKHLEIELKKLKAVVAKLKTQVENI